MKLPAGALGAALAGLSDQGVIIEAGGPLAHHTNLMLRLEAKIEVGGNHEFYTRVIRPLDESRNLYMIHFTPISPGVRNRLMQVSCASRPNKDY